MSIAAVILAAGFGTRLAPLTDHTPKPLLVVGDRPVATRLLERLVEIPELSQVVVVVNDCHLPQWHAWNATHSDYPRVCVVSNGVVDETRRPGAVADLRLAVGRVQPNQLDPVDWVMVVAGDNLLDEPLQPHMDAAMQRHCPVVLCRDLGADVPPGRFGEVTVDQSDIVVRFREKPAHPQSPYVATCSYVLPGDIGRDLGRYLESGDPDSPGGFIGWLASQRPVLARPLAGRYFDIGNHDTLAAARAAYGSSAAVSNDEPSARNE